MTMVLGPEPGEDRLRNPERNASHHPEGGLLDSVRRTGLHLISA
jgi:hypothetical protein